ncbi:MAG: hypothetical protein ACI8P0_000392 [Planctomycetaceae bacterium]|jgi:hypothetical protein
MSSGDQQSDGEYLYEEPADVDTSRILDNVLDLTEQIEGREIGEEVRQLALVVQQVNEDFVTHQGLTELVTETLRDYAQDARLSEETWKNLATKVATVLFEDPSARGRLDRLWQQLLEVRI